MWLFRDMFTFYQFSVFISFFHYWAISLLGTDKIASQARFGPRDVVWRPLHGTVRRECACDLEVFGGAQNVNGHCGLRPVVYNTLSGSLTKMFEDPWSTQKRLIVSHARETPTGRTATTRYASCERHCRVTIKLLFASSIPHRSWKGWTPSGCNPCSRSLSCGARRTFRIPSFRFRTASIAHICSARDVTKTIDC